MTAGRKLLATIAVMWLTILLCGESAAQDCPVSIALSGNTITATVSGGTCGDATIRIARDDDSNVADAVCWGQGTCTTSYTLRACDNPRTYQFEAFGQCGKPGQAPGSCFVEDGQASTSLTLAPTAPTVDGTFIPGANGIGTLSARYWFPADSPPIIQVFLNDATTPFRSAGDSHLDQEGVWETPLDVTCWPEGTHRLRFEATSCDKLGDSRYTDISHATINIENDPEVSLSASEPVNGNVTFTANYAFQNTTAGRVDLWVDGTYYGGEGPLAGSGTWTKVLPLNGCWKNAKVIALACGETAEDEVTKDSRKPVVNVTQLRGRRGANGMRKIKGRIQYDMLSNDTQPWSVRAWISRWIDNAGVEHPASTDLPLTPGATGRFGVKTFDEEAPYGARQVWVITSVSSCVGTTVKDTLFECDDCASSADPVFFADGNVLVTDGDPLPPIAGHRLTRTYNSDEQVAGLFGRGWTTIFDSRVTAHDDTDGERVVVTTETNEAVVFRRVGTGAFQQTWPTARRVKGSLSFDGGNYIYRAPGSSELRIFRGSDGRLIALRRAGTGHEASIAYHADGRPATFTDSWTGTEWTLATVGRRVTGITVSGLSWTYQYDASGNLTSVLAPGGGTWRTYEYTADLLTASRDALGNLIESHHYDADGYGIDSTGPQDEIASIQYDIAGSIPEETITRVTTKTGSVSDYVLRPVGGAYRVVQVRGSGCTSCGGHSGDRTYVHDAQGRVIREQTADGYVTLSVYDGDVLVSEERYLRPAACDPEADTDRCRMTTDALAAADLAPTISTIKTTYRYTDPLWPERPTVTEMPSVKAGEIRSDELSYHPLSGALVTQSVTGHSDGEVPTARGTMTSFYQAREQGDQDDGGLTPAFHPGDTFLAAWLALPQPALLRKSVDGPRADAEDVTSFVYYPLDPSVPALLRGHIAATRNAAGHITRFENYDIFGNVTRSVDANGVATEMTYDSLGRLKTTTIKGVPGCNASKDALCAVDLTATRRYSPAAGPLQSEERAGGGFIVYAYDSRGRIESTSRGLSVTDLRERREYAYDPLTGKKNLERRLAYEGGAWVEKFRETYAYDLEGDLETVTHADGSTVTYAYDAAGRLETIRDENHTAANKQYLYDPAGRIVTIKQRLNGAWIDTVFLYDIHGNLTSVTDPNGNVTSYTYDDFGAMLTKNSPITGLIRHGFDLAGNSIATTDANGVTTTRIYDALNRIVSQMSSAGASGSPADENDGRDGEPPPSPPAPARTETVTWSYDDATAGRHAIGRLSSMSDPAGVTTYEYERRGLLTHEGRTFSGCLVSRESAANCVDYFASRTYATGYGYDRDGNRSAIRYPTDLANVTYAFDYAGRPVSASGAVTSAKYLPYGPLNELTFDNGLVQKIEHDSRFRVFTNDLQSGQTTLAGYLYHHDAAGNITGIDDAKNADYNRGFAYDDLNRLTTSTTGAGLWQNGVYSWDAVGNILATNLAGTVRPKTQTFTYHGSTSRITGVTVNAVPTAVTHDAAGNERSFVATRTYSPRNLLQDVVRPAPGSAQDRVVYSYDGRGIRVVTGEQPAGSNVLSRRYYFYTSDARYLGVTFEDTSSQRPDQRDLRHAVVWFGDRPVAQILYGGDRRFTFTDHIGTPLLQTDSAASIVWRAEYEPFGDIHLLRAGNPGDQPLRFAGQDLAINWEGSEETYNIFRWYRSSFGRYTQPDPLGLQEDELTLYGYADRNPLVNTDPLGLVAAAPGQKKCDGFERAVRRLQDLKKNCKCRDFFGGHFGQNLSNLIDDPTITMTLNSSIGDGLTDCSVDPNGFLMNPRFCGRFEGGWNGGMTVQIVLHEMAHVADCRVGNRYQSPVDEGIPAEIACFGRSIDSRAAPGKSVPPLGPPVYAGPWR